MGLLYIEFSNLCKGCIRKRTKLLLAYKEFIKSSLLRVQKVSYVTTPPDEGVWSSGMILALGDSRVHLVEN